MGERCAAEVGVEERRHAAGPDDAEPDRGIFRPVGHHQADDIAFLDAVRHRPASVAVGAAVILGEGERFAVGEEGRAVAEFLCKVLGGVGEGSRLVAGHRRHDAERADDAAEEEPVTAEVVGESHLSRSHGRMRP